jgi:hypothetical protein
VSSTTNKAAGKSDPETKAVTVNESPVAALARASKISGLPRHNFEIHEILKEEFCSLSANSGLGGRHRAPHTDGGPDAGSRSSSTFSSLPECLARALERRFFFASLVAAFDANSGGKAADPVRRFCLARSL